MDNGAHTFLVHVHEIQIRENSKLIAILCGFRARLNFPLNNFTTKRTLITERAPVASKKKSYVPRKNSIVIKVLQQLFLDGSWRGGVREIIFFRRIGEGVFFLYYFKSFNFFRWWECSHHIQSALTSHYTNKFCKSKVQRILMTFFYLSWHFRETIYNFLSFHTIIVIAGIHFKNCKLK